MVEYDPKKDMRTLIRLLATTLDRATVFAQHIDRQTNILIGISSAIFLFTAGWIQSGEAELFLIILAIFAGLSSLAALFAIHPTRFMRKRGQEESLLYNKKIVSFEFAKDYGSQLDEISLDRDKMIEQYSLEIYNLYKYYYRPKRKLFNLSRNILICGVFVGLLVFVVGLF